MIKEFLLDWLELFLIITAIIFVIVFFAFLMVSGFYIFGALLLITSVSFGFTAMTWHIRREEQ